MYDDGHSSTIVLGFASQSFLNYGRAPASISCVIGGRDAPRIWIPAFRLSSVFCDATKDYYCPPLFPPMPVTSKHTDPMNTNDWRNPAPATRFMWITSYAINQPIGSGCIDLRWLTQNHVSSMDNLGIIVEPDASLIKSADANDSLKDRGSP